MFAVVRGIELVGEAARNVLPPIRARHPDIPWREICGMRDKLVHDYMGINLRVVWNTATGNLPELEPKLKRVLADAGV